MNSVRLQRFLAIYEHRSFGRAAAELHVTQPALTKSIQLLEEELGVKLFERTASGVVPTIYGEALSLHAKVIEAEMKNAAREIATLSGAVKGEVTIGVTPSVAADLIPRAFLKLQAERPGITVTVIEGLMEHHVPALRRGELDLVIGGWVRGDHPDLTTEILMRDEVLIFAGEDHPLAELASVPWQSLFDYPWVMPPHSQFWVQSLDQAFAARGLQPPVPAATTNSAGFIRAMLLRNLYLSALPARLLVNETRSGRIIALAIDGLDVGFDITMTYRTQVVRLPAFNYFVETLKAACAA
ncbi:MAG: LysR family transcriptional regulator [Allosphingosinicella sp.]